MPSFFVQFMGGFTVASDCSSCAVFSCIAIFLPKNSQYLKKALLRFDLINTLVPGKLIREKRIIGSGKVMIDFNSNMSASINAFFDVVKLFPITCSLLYCCVKYFVSDITFG